MDYDERLRPPSRRRLLIESNGHRKARCGQQPDLLTIPGDAGMRIANRWLLTVALLFITFPLQAHAQKGPETTLTKLPQDHDYQRTLHKFMASLTAKDFTHGVTEPIPLDKATNTDPEYLYRQHILNLMHQPLIGNKRGTPAVTAPPSVFLLSSIETPKGVMPPPVWAETLTSFIHWDYQGNLYRNNRALKLRAGCIPEK